LGFADITFKWFGYCDILKNIIVTAEKKEDFEIASLNRITKEILIDSLIDNREMELLLVWLKNYSRIFKP